MVMSVGNQSEGKYLAESRSAGRGKADDLLVQKTEIPNESQPRNIQYLKASDWRSDEVQMRMRKKKQRKKRDYSPRKSCSVASPIPLPTAMPELRGQGSIDPGATRPRKIRKWYLAALAAHGRISPNSS
jgi:hypothetical protein